MIEKYKVAKYIRLSNEDRYKIESDSVENQRDIIDNFIKNNTDLEIFDEYIDDGYTGGNFDRPRFKQMIKDIEDGKVNCIITKDLSRFGRDHIDTGYYLERYLPRMNIRYIAIGDGVDTKDLKGLQFLSFKLSFNDYYLKDISNKVKSVKKKKMIAGEYQAGIAPYGYKKDTEIKNHLIIDENVYHIVQEIFDMYANKGMSTIKIADELNRRNVTPPGIYMKMPSTTKNLNSKNPDGRYVWLRTQIGSMLKNQVYIGSVVSGKKEQISPKIKKGICKNKSDYTIVKNMHESIISEELWNKVQNKLNSYHTDNRKKYEYPLKNLVYCAECGNKARFQHSRKKTKTGEVCWEGNSAICSKRADYVSLCNNGLIGEKLLINAVRDTIIEEINKIEFTSKELKNMYIKAQKKEKGNENDIQSELKYKNNELDKIINEISNLYEKKIKKQISVEEFKEIYQKMSEKKTEIKKEIDTLNENKKNNRSKQLKEKKNENKRIEKIAKEFLKLENPNNEILKKLVKKITFDKNKNIIVELTFSKKI